MIQFRHLIRMMTVAAGLMLSASQSFAQQPDVGDQPGLLPDDSVLLAPEFRKQMVYYRTTEAPGTIIISTAERHLYLVQGNDRRHTLWHRGRPRRISMAGAAEHYPQGGMAGLDTAARDDLAPALSAALHGRRPRQPARRPRDVSRDHRLSYPRHQPAGYDRHRHLVRLLPAGQRRCFRPLWSRSGRHQGDRAPKAVAVAAAPLHSPSIFPIIARENHADIPRRPPDRAGDRIRDRGRRRHL